MRVMSLAARPNPAPWAVRVARVLLGLIALDHLVFLLAILIDRRADGGHLIPSLVSNGFLLVLSTALVFALPTGHRWARRPATISQCFGITLSALLWPTGTVLVGVVPTVDVISVAVVALLWAPAASREFFAAGPGGRTWSTPETG
jgi:hypothetical protein